MSVQQYKIERIDKMASEYTPSRRSYDRPVDPARCKALVITNDRASIPYQCKRKPWKDGWCRQHHPDTEAERKLKKRERYERKFQSSPVGRLVAALDEIDRLRAVNAELVKALEDARRAIASLPDDVLGIGGDELTHWYYSHELLDKLDAALARAKGEQ